jgi:hypothetical protein
MGFEETFAIKLSKMFQLVQDINEPFYEHVIYTWLSLDKGKFVGHLKDYFYSWSELLIEL